MPQPDPVAPVVVSTWPFGMPANEVAWKMLQADDSALDAVERGIASCEDDESVDSVGYGGLPDASGEVTLDASIMDDRGRCGAVAVLKRVKNPICVARLVMERTRHVMLAGEGATLFALENGLPESDLLSPKAKEAYEAWKAKHAQDKSDASVPKGVPKDSHDTIGMLALDKQGRLAGGCSTSGMAYKLPGRIGDSPIIGAGLYVEPGVAAATATGEGEQMIKVAAAFSVADNLRRGMEPEEALRDVLQRILKRRNGDANTDVSLIALRQDGRTAGLSLRAATNFRYALITPAGKELVTPPSLL